MVKNKRQLEEATKRTALSEAKKAYALYMDGKGHELVRWQFERMLDHDIVLNLTPAQFSDIEALRDSYENKKTGSGHGASHQGEDEHGDDGLRGPDVPPHRGPR